MGIHIILNSILMYVMMTTPTHRLPRLRIGERPLDIMVSSEYNITNKLCRTKIQDALWQGTVPVSHPRRVMQMCME